MPFTYDTFKQMIDEAHADGARDIRVRRQQRQLQQFDDAWALTAHMKVRVRNGPMLAAGLVAWIGLAVLVGVLVLGIGRIL